MFVDIIATNKENKMQKSNYTNAEISGKFLQSEANIKNSVKESTFTSANHSRAHEKHHSTPRP